MHALMAETFGAQPDLLAVKIAQSKFLDSRVVWERLFSPKKSQSLIFSTRSAVRTLS
jgi:hypothetical protein